MYYSMIDTVQRRCSHLSCLTCIYTLCLLNHQITNIQVAAWLFILNFLPQKHRLSLDQIILLNASMEFMSLFRRVIHDPFHCLISVLLFFFYSIQVALCSDANDVLLTDGNQTSIDSKCKTIPLYVSSFTDCIFVIVHQRAGSIECNVEVVSLTIIIQC